MFYQTPDMLTLNYSFEGGRRGNIYILANIFSSPSRDGPDRI